MENSECGIRNEFSLRSVDWLRHELRPTHELKRIIAEKRDTFF